MNPTYEVLYYKRTNKVHKSKGVSKLDGLLILQPEKGIVILRSADDTPHSSNDEEEQTPGKYGSKKASFKKQSTSPTIYSGINPSIANRSLEDDETFPLGGFEVQIVYSKNGNNKSIGTGAFRSSIGRVKTLPRKNPVKSSTSRKNVNAIATLPQKRPPPPQNPLTNRTRSLQPVVRNRTLVKQQAKTRTFPTAVAAPRISQSISHASISHIPLTASIRNVLRPHQVSGIKGIWNRLTGERRGALLADEMGLGKTLMTVATIAALHKQKRRHFFVVVCPSSLVANWDKEFDKWLGKAGQPKRVVIKKGGAEGQQEIRSFCGGMKQNRANQVGQVLILSYELFRLNVQLFRSIREGSVELLVCDEAHRLKGAGSQTITALESLSTNARLCITATPIQNNLSEFYHVANFVSPGVLGELNHFRKEFDQPISNANSKSTSSEQKRKAKQQSEILDQIIKSFMLRRLASDVLKQMLPPRSEILLFTPPSSKQCQEYRRIASDAHGSSSTEILTALTELRKICIHPDLVAMDACSEDSDLQLSGKLSLLKSLLFSIREKAPNDKVVIVSNFTTALSLIEKLVLKPNTWSYVRLDGSTDVKNRQSLVDSFNATSAERSFCFLLSAKAGGCGLNLIGANRLVLVDPDWNPATDIQAMGRVYRQGQTKPTTIYRLFLSGTVEEVIYQRQIQKNNLAGVTVDGKSLASSFTRDELRDSLTLKEGIASDTRSKIGQEWLDYTGLASLEALNQFDAPLFHVAETNPSKMLGYVHFVENPDEILKAATPTKSSSVPPTQKADGMYFSSDAESDWEF